MSFYENYWSNKIKNRALNNDDERHFNLKWPKLKKYLPKQGTIVDFGCGDGEILKKMQTINPNAKYIGLDVSRFALDKASSKLPDVEFHQIIDGGSFPVENGSVDFIFSSEVIEHIYDSKNAFLEMNRILRPNGRILLTTPYHGILKNIILAFFNFEKHFDPTGPHIRFYTKKSLFFCLRTFVGGGILEYGYFGRFFPIPHCIFVLAEKK